MTRVLAVAAIVVVVLAVWGLMLRGWRSRAAAQTHLPEPAHPTEPLTGPAFEGVYVSTTSHGDWLDRIVAHGLGVRSEVSAHVTDGGIALVRTGAPSVLIERGDLVGAGRAAGMAGKFVERGGLAVITWRLGDAVVDTGLRLRRADETAQLVAAVQALVPPPTGSPDSEVPQ